MSTNLVTCAPDERLPGIAATMAERGVHSVIVRDAAAGPRSPGWRLLTDLDLVSAAPRDLARTAISLARTPAVVDAGDSLAHAAAAMEAHGTAHLLVVEEGAEGPVGLLSAMDVARAIAGGAPRPDGW
jgi:CBS domain-containing protein